MFDRVRFRKNKDAQPGPDQTADEEKKKKRASVLEQPPAADEQDNEEDNGFDLLSILAGYHQLAPDAFEAPYKSALSAFRAAEGLQVPSALSEDLPLIVKARGFEDKPIEIYSDRVEIPGSLLSAEDTRTALLLAIATVNQPEYLKTGVVLEGTEEQQLLLAAAAKVVGLPVVNPPKIPKDLLKRMEAELPQLLAELARKDNPRNEAKPPKAGFSQNKQNRPAIEPAVNEAGPEEDTPTPDSPDSENSTVDTPASNSPFPLTDEVREALRDHLSMAKGGGEVTDDEINEFWDDSISNRQKRQILADPQSLIRQVEAQKQQKEAKDAQRRAKAKQDPGFKEFAREKFAADGDTADYADEEKLTEKLDSLEPEEIDSLIENYIDDQTKKQRKAVLENPKFRDFAKEQLAAEDTETDYSDDAKLTEKLESLDDHALENLVGKFNEAEQKKQHEKLVKFLQEKLKKPEDEGELSEEEVFARLQQLDPQEGEKLFREFQEQAQANAAAQEAGQNAEQDHEDTPLTDEIKQELKDFAAKHGEEVPSDEQMEEEWANATPAEKSKLLQDIRAINEADRKQEAEGKAFEEAVTTENILDKPEILTVLREVIADGGDSKDYTDEDLQAYWAKADREKRADILNYQKGPKPPKPGNKPGGDNAAEAEVTEEIAPNDDAPAAEEVTPAEEATPVEEVADNDNEPAVDEATPAEVVADNDNESLAEDLTPAAEAEPVEEVADNDNEPATEEQPAAEDTAPVEEAAPTEEAAANDGPISPAAYEKVKEAVLSSGQTNKRFIRSILGKAGDDKPANMNKAVTAAQHKMLEEGIIEPKGSGRNQGYRLVPQETSEAAQPAPAEDIQTGQTADEKVTAAPVENVSEEAQETPAEDTAEDEARTAPVDEAEEPTQETQEAAETPETPKAKKTAKPDFEKSVLRSALPEEVKLVLKHKGVTQTLYKDVFKAVVRAQDASDSAIEEKVDAYIAAHQTGRDAKLQSKLGKDFLLASIKTAMVTHDILKPETTRLAVDENGYKKQPPPPPQNKGGTDLPVHLL